MKRIGSEITGALSEASEASSSIGRPHGATGSDVVVTTVADAAWLLSFPTPMAADGEMLRSLTSGCGVTLRTQVEGRYPQDAPAYTVVVARYVDLAEWADLEKARALVAKMFAPASEAEIGAWLAQLQAACARRPGTEGAAALQYKLYLDELRNYPADITRCACRKLMRGTGDVNWFPTLSEVIGECDRLVESRRGIAAAVQSGWRGPRDEIRAPAGGPKGKKDIEAVAKMAAEFRAKMAELNPPKERPEIRPNFAKIDERGVSLELKALLERQKTCSI